MSDVAKRKRQLEAIRDAIGEYFDSQKGGIVHYSIEFPSGWGLADPFPNVHPEPALFGNRVQAIVRFSRVPDKAHVISEVTESVAPSHLKSVVKEKLSGLSPETDVPLIDIESLKRAAETRQIALSDDLSRLHPATLGLVIKACARAYKKRTGMAHPDMERAISFLMGVHEHQSRANR